MSTLLSAPFENGLTGGLAYDSLNNGGNLTVDTSQFRHGASAMKVTGNAAFSIFGQKNVSTTILTRSFYLRFTALPASNCLIARATGPAQVPGISLNPTGKLQSHIGSTDQVTLPSTILSANTWYLIDVRFDTSTTTYKVDFKISDTNGTLLSTAGQLTLAGQSITAMTASLTGQCASVALTAYFDDDQATDQTADYPIGAHTSVDGTFPAITSFPPTWIDHPGFISGGVLYGMMTLNTGTSDSGQTAAAEGATKANRPVYVVQSFYNNIQSAGVLTFEKQIQNGSLIGHQMWPMLHPLGFGSTTVNWPAAGCAAFTNGSQDTYLAAWVTVMNNQLGSTPFLVRFFREMTNNVTIYGRNGSTVGGLNETTSSFIAAWQYIDTYFRTRVPMYRSVWCPDTNTAPADTVQWYPGDAYVDWIGVDAYGVSGNSYTPATALTAHHDAYKTGGTLGLAKPLMVCETQIQKADTNRSTDFSAYTTTFTTLNQYKVVNMWDSAATGPYTVTDTPAGFLATFQSVVGSAPFLGAISFTYTDAPTGTISISGSRSESYSHLSSYSDTPIGTIRLSGSRSESYATPSRLRHDVRVVGVRMAV